MKGYENISRTYLTKRMPVIIRIDGKSFHTFTRGFQHPFDPVLIDSMLDTAAYLCENIMGCKFAYVQSDEISLLLTDYDKLTTEPWFGKNIQKMTSISASMATMKFNQEFADKVESYKHFVGDVDIIQTYNKKLGTAVFDSRVFVIPREDVCNYFIWRQQDATRNAIQMLGRYYYSQSSLMNVDCSKIQDMLFNEMDVNFNDLPTYYKRGACIVKVEYDLEDGVKRNKWITDADIPIFTKDNEYINKFVNCEELNMNIIIQSIIDTIKIFFIFIVFILWGLTAFAPLWIYIYMLFFGYIRMSIINIIVCIFVGVFYIILYINYITRKSGVNELK